MDPGFPHLQTTISEDWAVERHLSPKWKISVKKNGIRNGNLSKSLIDIDDPEQVLGLKSMETHSTEKEHLKLKRDWKLYASEGVQAMVPLKHFCQGKIYQY
ncbi:uncharacterized protein [Narcine bancroftii]|uniref:uncharacterized protein isoform X2 n=1 Tax=Narcine bancroftii TaxID=1343680 RepID=UPI0038313906